MTLVNNTAAINEVLKAWNLSHGWPREPGESSSSGDVPTTGFGGSEGGPSGSGEVGGSSETNEPPLAAEPTGCGCREEGSGPAGLLLLGLLGLRRRRG